jgi:hypothetical protein
MCFICRVLLSISSATEHEKMSSKCHLFECQKQLLCPSLVSECVVVPDDWIVIHSRLVADHSHGLFRGRICMGDQVYKGYVISVCCEYIDLNQETFNNIQQHHHCRHCRFR